MFSCECHEVFPMCGLAWDSSIQVSRKRSKMSKLGKQHVVGRALVMGRLWIGPTLTQIGQLVLGIDGLRVKLLTPNKLRNVFVK